MYGRTHPHNSLNKVQYLSSLGTLTVALFVRLSLKAAFPASAINLVVVPSDA